MLGLLVFSQASLDIGISQVWLPVKQSSSVLVIVELIEYGCAESYFFGKNSQNIFEVLRIIRPVTGRKHLHTQITVELLKKCGCSKFVHCVLAHFNVAEHNL